MFFHRARPEPEWRGARGVSEVTVRAEVLFEGEREFQAIRQDIVDDNSPQPAAPFATTDAPESQNKFRKKLNLFRRRKDAAVVIEAEPNETAEAIDRLQNIKFEPVPLRSHLQKPASRIPEAKESYRAILFRKKAPSESSTCTSKVSTTSNRSQADYFDHPAGRSTNETRESSEEAHSTKDKSAYSGFGAKKARGFFSRSKSNSKSAEEEDKTPTPLKHGIKSLMKVAQENPEDSPLHGSPSAYEGTSISESFSWRDNSTRGGDTLWNRSCADSPSNASSTTSTWEVVHARDAVAVTSPNSTQSTLDRRRGLFAFRRDGNTKTGSLRNAHKAERKRFASKNKKGQTCTDREATEQLNQMISLVASADDDEDEEDLGSRFSWAESQGPWPSAAHSPLTPLSSQGLHVSCGSSTAPGGTTDCATAGAHLDEHGRPSPGSRLSDWSTLSNTRHHSPDASFDSLRTASLDSQQQLSTATDDWVADFSVFDSPQYSNPNLHPDKQQQQQQPQSAVDLRAHLATAKRLLNTSKDSVESITSRDNMSPLPWTPQNTRQYNNRGMATRGTAVAAAPPQGGAKKGKQENQTNKSNELPVVAKEEERRSRQRPRSWFRGAKGDADVFREAQTLLDILHETFPEGDIDSPGSDLRTVY